MMLLLFGYLGVLFRWGGKTCGENDEEDEASEQDAPNNGVVRSLLGLVMIVGGAHLLVECASDVARVFGMSEWAIGVTIVAAGTSAPELVTCLVAALKGKHGISAGALIGSDLYNLLGVLGLASFLAPMSVDESAKSSVFLLIAMVTLVVVFMRSGWRVGRREGIALVGINLVRWGMDIGVVSW
jgi:cation:H+ antiporter